MASVATTLFNNMDKVSNTFVAQNLSNVIVSVTPVVAAALSCVLAFEGAQLLVNPNAEPLSTLMQRFLRWGLILSIATAGGLYQSQIANVITTLPDSFATLFVTSAGNAGTSETTMGSSIDHMLDLGLKTASQAWEGGGFFTSAGIMLIFEAAIIFTSTCVITAFGVAFIVFAKFMLAISVALGPIAIFCLLFKATNNLFGKWVSVCLHYGLISVLLAITFGLLMSFYTNAIALTAADTTGSILGGAATALILTIVSIIIVMQVPQMAARLGDGVAVAAPTIADAVNGGKSAARMAGNRSQGKAQAASTQAMSKAAQAMETAAASMGGPAGQAAAAVSNVSRGLARGSSGG